MAGLQDPDVVDLVAQDADGRYLVVMVEERPWGADPDQPRQLREKINAYAGFVLDGELARRHPEIGLGADVRIQLNCPQQPEGEIAAIAQHAAAQLGRLGIGFAVRVLPAKPGAR
ncbi:MAG TPA: DUF6572 domain-containing protein [Candidatus Dormibacteraeota bacterium]